MSPVISLVFMCHQNILNKKKISTSEANNTDRISCLILIWVYKLLQKSANPKIHRRWDFLGAVLPRQHHLTTLSDFPLWWIFNTRGLIHQHTVSLVIGPPKWIDTKSTTGLKAQFLFFYIWEELNPDHLNNWQVFCF